MADDPAGTSAIAKYLAEDPLELRLERLAREFRTEEALVRRWAAGSAKPPPDVLPKIMDWIKKELTPCVKRS